MGKEKVLDIEFKEVWDNKWAWKITKNNLDFKNTGGEIISEGVKIICSDKESLYLFDNWLVEWEILEDWSLVDPNKKSEIENFVKYINSTYGIQKRWRGKRSDKYFSIFGDSEISETTDNYFPEDQRRYEWGNYFKTLEEAEKVKAELDKFWAKVRAGEIGGEE